MDGDGYRPELEAPIHRTIKKVTEDIDNLKANTAIAAMMSLLNAIADTGAVTKGELRTLTLLLNPFAPHMTDVYKRQNMRCAAKSVWRGAGSVGCSAGSGVICAGSAGERAWAIRIKLSTKKAEAVWNRSFKLTGAGKE